MAFSIPANALLALGSAALWGGGDFSGGMGVGSAGGTPRAALRVVLVSHIFTLSLLAALVVYGHNGMPHGGPLGWALLAGFCAGVSLTCFYMALSRGGMGASAAVSGLLAAAIPALVSVAMEGRPSAQRVVGFAVAALAIWMIAAGPSAERTDRTTLALASTAGLGFGVYFTALRMANPLGVYLPMAVARVGSISTCCLLLLGFAVWPGAVKTESPTGKLSGKTIAWALTAGLLDTAGNLLFIAATRAGRLDVAAVLASLYPASTIVLAGWLLKETLSRRQLAGMGVAAGAVALITL